jgi:hypothetical protein
MLILSTTKTTSEKEIPVNALYTLLCEGQPSTRLDFPAQRIAIHIVIFCPWMNNS